LSLYKGLIPPLLGAGFVNAVIFLSYGQLNYLQHKYRQHSSGSISKEPTLKEVTLSGLGTGVAQVSFITPIEGIKCLLQGQKNHQFYTGTADCIKKVYEVAGIRGLFRGLLVTTLRDTPTFGVYFLSYEWFKRSIFSPSPGVLNQETPKMGMFVSGGIAGVLGWLVTYPLDVIKSRIQTDSFTRPQYSGIIDCVKKSYLESGWRVFFKGLVATLARAFVVNGVTFLGYEFSLGILHKQHDKHFL